MNIFFRVLLALYAFCLAIFSAIAMLVTIRTDFFTTIYDYLDANILSVESHGPRIALFVCAFLFFILSLMFLLSGVRSSKDKKAVSKHTSIGEIRISLGSIENIVLTASRKITGVRETKAYVRKVNDTVSIAVKVVVAPDINIPAVSEEIQTRVKTSVEDSSGIPVKDVRVVVENIQASSNSPAVVAVKSRVE